MCALKLSICAKERNAICAQRVRLPIKVGVDSIIQVVSDSLLSCSIIYKFEAYLDVQLSQYNSMNDF